MDKKRITKTEIFKVIAAILGIVILVGVALKESNRNKIEAPEAEPEVTIITTTETTPVTTLVSTSAVTTTLITTTDAITDVTTTETITEVTEIVTDAPVIEVVPETEAPKEEPVVNTEPIVEVQPVETEKQEEYLVYKESTHYIHKNTCRWNKDDAVRVDDVTGLEARLCNECSPQCEGYTEYVEPVKETPGEYVGEFQATYYTAWIGACGGSGRSLIDCSYGLDVKGSIASSTLYNLYGYNRNGRTTVYIECDSCPSLTGNYYLDDSTAGWVSYTIDFYYDSSYNCPFQYTGRLYGLRVYVY
jgi:hypothetical protein